MVDSGADNTIMGGTMFKHVAAVAKLRKKDFKPPDKVPRNYDQHPSGLIDLDITFYDKTMNTPVYVKMDAKEQLLLSEGVCRQLGVITYHPDVEPRKALIMKLHQSAPQNSAHVPTVRVQSTRLLPNQSVVAEACLTNCDRHSGPLLIEPNATLTRKQGFDVVESLVTTSDTNTVRVMLANSSGLTQRV